MATGSGKIAMKLQDYFDSLAPTWDREIRWEGVNCLKNIVQELEIETGSCVLDIGSGTGILSPFLTEVVGEEGRSIALDFSRKMLLEARAKDSFAVTDCIQADVSAIPLCDNCVDLALCNSVFPHFGDKAKALREIARVLRDSGRLVICHTMSREKLNQLHRSIGGIVANDFLPDEFKLKEMMERAGLAITCLEDSPKRYLLTARKAA